MICRHRNKFEYLIFSSAFQVLFRIFRYIFCLTLHHSWLKPSLYPKKSINYFAPFFQTISKTPMMLTSSILNRLLQLICSSFMEIVEAFYKSQLVCSLPCQCQYTYKYSEYCVHSERKKQHVTMLISLFNHYVNLKFSRKIPKHHFQGGRYQISIKHV